MSQSAHQGLEDRNDLDSRLSSTSSNRPLEEKSNSGDSSGRPSQYTESMAAEDEERKRLAAVVEDLSGIIAFSCLLIVIIALSLSGSLPSLRPDSDSVNPNVAHATIPLDSPAAGQPPTYAIWSIPGRLFSVATALITALLVGLSLRWPGDGDHPTQHDAWYQVTLCLYIIALVKFLLGVDFGLFITVTWWIGFLSVAPHHLARGRAVARTLREHQHFPHQPGCCIPAYNT